MVTIKECSLVSGCPNMNMPFADNRIDLSVRPELTDQTWKMLGERRKMLRAIRELGSTAPASRAERLDWSAPQPCSQDAAERCCTELAERNGDAKAGPCAPASA